MACYNDDHRKSIAVGVKRFWELHPEAKDNLRRKVVNGELLSVKRLTDSDRELGRMQRAENFVGGFWYGSVRNDPIRKPPSSDQSRKYCEMWTEDLRERIRAYWGYASALSGKTETSLTRLGFQRTISCHHVYYQKKACCVWDEDENGYYANINIGSTLNPVIERYYIDGDPNKFVTLTASEHKRTDTNKIYWIKTFEKIIDDAGGKCYFTKNEIEELLLPCPHKCESQYQQPNPHENRCNPCKGNSPTD